MSKFTFIAAILFVLSIAQLVIDPMKGEATSPLSGLALLVLIASGVVLLMRLLFD